jgi:hypothetical protein
VNSAFTANIAKATLIESSGFNINHSTLEFETEGELCPYRDIAKATLIESSGFNINTARLKFETEGELCPYREHRQSHT